MGFRAFGCDGCDDTTDKLDVYQSIPEMTHYVVVDSRRRAVRLYERNSDGSFSTRSQIARLSLPNLIDDGLSIEDIYRDTTVPKVEESQGTDFSEAL